MGAGTFGNGIAELRSLHRTKNKDETMFHKKMIQKFTKSED